MTTFQPIRLRSRTLLVLVAGAWCVATGRTLAALVVIFIGGHVVGLAALRPGTMAAADRHLAGAARALAKAVAWMALTLVFTILVTPAWLIARLLRLDALARGPAGTWRPSLESAPARSFSRERAHRGTPRAAWLALGVAVLLAAAVLIDRDPSDDGVAAEQGDTPSPVRAFDGLTYDEYGHDDEPWAEALYREETQASRFLYDPVLGFRLPDVSGRYFNVVGGFRASRSPPDPTLTVWFFGGSTMFGIGQRDDHTIPSSISRFAEDDGLAVLPLNFGVPAYVTRQETILFQHLLTRRPAPDLVVFYDGLNDLGLQFQRAGQGDLDLDRPSILGAETFEQVLGDAGVLAPGEPTDPPQGDRSEEVFRTTAEHYRDGVEMATWAADANRVPIRFFWQPQALTKRPSPADAPLFDRLGIDRANQPSTSARIAAVADEVGVIDLTDALDDIDVPVYLDAGHTNELGAAVIARALYLRLRPLLYELS